MARNLRLIIKMCTFNRLLKCSISIIFVLLLFEYGTYSATSKDKIISSNHLITTNEDHGTMVNISFHKDTYAVDRFYDKHKSWHTSNLGSVMFKNIDKSEFLHDRKENKTFVVFIWKYWNWLKRRHIYNFKKSRSDPLEDCSVKNCQFMGQPAVFNKTVENYILNNADAVIVHIQRGHVPELVNRKPNQRWIFLSDESPKNTFSMTSAPPKLRNLAGIFNWSMTYRSDSDVPVPYGRTIGLSEPRILNITLEKLSEIVPYWKQKRHDTLAAVLMSNCKVSKRMEYLKELVKHMKVDIRGKCATNKALKNSCPGHFASDCKVMRQYLFYLVLENTKCRQYLTEKGFFHAYSKGAIPVIMGPPKEDCEKLLPPNSYLHVDDYESPKDLAKEIENISRSNRTLLRFHLWRNKFAVLNEHGYFGTRSYHLCRVCEALNYNDRSVKVYDEDELKLFLDPSLLCQK